MDKKDFCFELPQELIAQTPIEKRDESRLLCLDRHSGRIVHSKFSRLPGMLRDGDCLVLNDSRVMPARLLGRRETGGAVEVLLLREIGGGIWECLTRPGAKTKTGAKLIFGDGELTATVAAETDEGNRLISFMTGQERRAAVLDEQILDRLGKMPLPPYIHEELQDSERYQTVYSRNTGSAAAPTAGLHFTNDLLEAISEKGVTLCFITLHVGLGTFRPVKADVIEEHKMHSEFFIIPNETALAVNNAKSRGRRVIAVGTTSCRALESCAAPNSKFGDIRPYSGFTDIFIYPGYSFKCVDGLITNFHLPESTLIMLVSAFAGRENVLRAYGEAIRERYRFFSFGDAMLVV